MRRSTATTDLTYTESITDYKNVCVVVGAEGTATVGAAENTGSAGGS